MSEVIITENLGKKYIISHQAEAQYTALRDVIADGAKRLLRTKIPRRFLNEGKYRIELLASLYNRCWIFEPCKNAPTITITIQGNLSDSPYWMVKRPGILAPVNDWEIDSK
ncbi:unnamed protein product [marine sediment metagenome]|uniref:Uncharacterized protein n=1 Tax=marine sediment metagenome TaxID=412755 RepID=X1BVA0_9ZZZZ